MDVIPTGSKCLLFSRGRIPMIARALSSEARVMILDLLQKGPYTVTQLAQELGIAQPAVSKHVQILEEAGLIQTVPGTSERGATKLCYRTYNEIHFHFATLPEPALSDRLTLTMPVGGFSRCEVHPTCGLASAESLIGYYDDPRSFYLPERLKAEILWFGWGYVEYDFPNPLVAGQKVDRLELSLELCSEAPGYEVDYPSEITFSINNREIGCWLCPGDMGDQRGLLNPSWWPDTNTQYGFLKSISVGQDGASIDGVKVSTVTPEDLIDRSKPFITVRIEVKENAKFRGGVNIFGKSFGNYRQDIYFTVVSHPENNQNRATS